MIKKIKAVMVFIFDIDKNLLILKRNDNNKWEVVKGGFQGEENYLTAGIREIKEETGLIINNLNLLKIADDEILKENGTKLKIKGYVTYIYLNLIKPEINIINNTDNEHSEYDWINKNELDKIVLYPEKANDWLKEIIKQDVF